MNFIWYCTMGGSTKTLISKLIKIWHHVNWVSLARIFMLPCHNVTVIWLIRSISPWICLSTTTANTSICQAPRPIYIVHDDVMQTMVSRSVVKWRTFGSFGSYRDFQASLIWITWNSHYFRYRYKYIKILSKYETHLSSIRRRNEVLITQTAPLTYENVTLKLHLACSEYLIKMWYIQTWKRIRNSPHVCQFHTMLYH